MSRVLPRAARDRKLPPREPMFVQFDEVEPGDIFVTNINDYRRWHGKRIREVELTSVCVNGALAPRQEGGHWAEHPGVYIRFHDLPAIHLCAVCISASGGLPLVRIERERGE